MQAVNDIQVGQYFGEAKIEITPEMIRHYAEALQDFNPWYFGDSPFGGPVAPALILHSEVYRSVDWYLSYYGNLHAKQEWEIFGPIMAGETVTGRRQIIDRYQKRDREYLVNETTLYGADGRMLNRGRTHQSFLANHGTEGVVVDKDREKRSDRKFETAEETVLEEIAGQQKHITTEMCMAFSGPNKNYHTDVEEAHKLGFPDIVVQGMMSLCFISEMMTQRFGEGWLAGGRMSVNLVNVLWGNERAMARGAVVSEAAEGARTRSQVRVWCEKEDGTKVVVGTASALRG
jgi:acyl dehydratase